MIYADEEFYNGKYLLWRKPVISAGFSFYARQASQVIDRYTFNRLTGMLEIPEEVRLCCCELAEAGYRQEKAEKESFGKTSEKVGTYSVSFGSAQDQDEARTRKERQIIMKWLEHTGLCYQGVE